MTGVADENASAERFAVMLPNLFDRGSWFSCVCRAMKDMRAGKGRGINDLIVPGNWLAGQSQPMAVI
jgi:hypothetical protein